MTLLYTGFVPLPHILMTLSAAELSTIRVSPEVAAEINKGIAMSMETDPYDTLVQRVKDMKFSKYDYEFILIAMRAAYRLGQLDGEREYKSVIYPDAA